MSEAFDKTAHTWCKHCGSGDSVMEYRQITSKISYDIDGDWPNEVKDEQLVGIEFMCEDCGASADTVEEMVTESPSEAYNIWLANHPEPQEEWDEPYYEDGE